MNKYAIVGKLSDEATPYGTSGSRLIPFDTEQDALDYASDYLAKNPSIKKLTMLGPIKTISLKESPIEIQDIK